MRPGCPLINSDSADNRLKLSGLPNDRSAWPVSKGSFDAIRYACICTYRKLASTEIVRQLKRGNHHDAKPFAAFMEHWTLLQASGLKDFGDFLMQVEKASSIEVS
jgi:hypothetical protein